MRQVVIDDPILNSPFVEPTRHFEFGAEGITNQILTGRRPSSHFVPIPRAKTQGRQLQFETEWTNDRIEPNPVVDRIRQRVGAWRQGGYVGVTGVTSRLRTGRVRAATSRSPSVRSRPPKPPSTLLVTHILGIRAVGTQAPAVNNRSGFGRWAFVEVTDPWDAQWTIRAAVQAAGAAAL